MKLLEEIRNQPEHIRHVMMWLCVVTTFSFVALVWFRTTETRLVAMLHPTDSLEAPPADRFADRDLRKLAEDRILAAKQDNSASPLASILNSFSLLRASIGELLGNSQAEISQTANSKILQNSSLNNGQAKALPLSKDK